jgi:hypothetical protein
MGLAQAGSPEMNIEIVRERVIFKLRSGGAPWHSQHYDARAWIKAVEKIILSRQSSAIVALKAFGAERLLESAVCRLYVFKYRITAAWRLELFTNCMSYQWATTGGVH